MSTDTEQARGPDARIDYQASPEIHEVIARISRTEDVRLSPDNRRLVVVDFIANRIFLFTLRIDTDGESPRIEFLETCILTSSSFAQPHGLAFLGNDCLAVANRAGDVCLYRLPAIGACPAELDLRPVARINGQGMLLAKVKTPGSLDSYHLGGDRYRILVCNNHWHFISAHTVYLGRHPRIRNEGLLIQAALKLPDGISLSPDASLIVISNHVDGEVLIYRNTPDLDTHTRPVAVLKGIVCPHGLRFDGNDRVIVADASSQYLLVYEARDGRWQPEQYPDRWLKLLDDDTFYDGRYDTREGGIKGLDMDVTGRVLVTTHRLGVLGFYDLRRLLARDDGVDTAEIAELCERRDVSIARSKSTVLIRQWTWRWRAAQAWSDWQKWRRQYRERVRTQLKLRQLQLHNCWSKAPLCEPGGPVVSLTSHGARLATVHYTLESIGMGNLRPGRLILWLNDPKAVADPPVALKRLVARGLEIRLTEDFGPHTKYYPYVSGERAAMLPLVTADDDNIYPQFWLEKLVEAYAADPSLIRCYRARRIAVQNGRIMPYNEWSLCTDPQPSPLNFITGVSGAIYPPVFQDYLRQQGSVFRDCCPYADDIWLSVSALRGGFRVAQVTAYPYHFRHVPGSQLTCLHNLNNLKGYNQAQLRRTYTDADLAALCECGEGVVGEALAQA